LQLDFDTSNAIFPKILEKTKGSFRAPARCGISYFDLIHSGVQMVRGGSTFVYANIHTGMPNHFELICNAALGL